MSRRDVPRCGPREPQRSDSLVQALLWLSQADGDAVGRRWASDSARSELSGIATGEKHDQQPDAELLLIVDADLDFMNGRLRLRLRIGRDDVRRPLQGVAGGAHLAMRGRL